VEYAIARACFMGLPCFISVFRLLLKASGEELFFKGIGEVGGDLKPSL
jgi:hypothetical protein